MLKIQNKNNKYDDNFLNALLQIEQCPHNNSSIVSQSLVNKFRLHNFDEIGYNIPQLFEPGILTEIGLLTSISEGDLLNFNYHGDDNLQKLKWLISNQNFLSPFTKINLSYCLISFCRYRQASQLLMMVDYNCLPRDYKFYYLMADFYISNRFENGKRSDDIFRLKKNLIESTKIDPLLILQSCTQAIVWHLKTKEISLEIFTYFMNLGENIVNQGIDADNCYTKSLISGWYRALAMFPAFNKDLETTRKYMDLSKVSAEEITPKNDLEELAKRHMLKTYFESEAKEYLYFHKDPKQAEQSALNMINQDPYWSLSWAELGEIYCHEKNYEKALDAYTKSYEFGFPRKIRSYFYMGNCKALMGNVEEALSIFEEILSVDQQNISAALAGYKYSKLKNVSLSQHFSSYLNDYVEKGLISNEKINNMMAA